jgi:acid stress chaperone HdeB
MKSYRLIALAASTVILVSPVIAAEIDMSTLTCKEVSAMRSSKIAVVAAWMNGYLHGKKGSGMLDTDKLVENMDKVKDLCGQTPDATLAKVIDLVAQKM